MRIAVLALQGAFIEHEHIVQQLGVETFEVRQLSDWQQPKNGLIIPGGESTTIKKLLHELGLYLPIRQAIAEGLPVFGTCAGLILLAKQVAAPSHSESSTLLSAARMENLPHAGEAPQDSWDSLATMNIEVVRNAYGRQLGSFYVEAPFHQAPSNLPMTFIRAPYINKVWGDAVSLAEVDGHIVAAQQGNQLVTAFHPELNNDTYVHEYFLDIVCRA